MILGLNFPESFSLHRSCFLRNNPCYYRVQVAQDRGQNPPSYHWRPQNPLGFWYTSPRCAGETELVTAPALTGRALEMNLGASCAATTDGSPESPSWKRQKRFRG